MLRGTYRYCIAAIVLLPLLACSRNGANTVSVTGQIEATSIGVGSRIGGRVEEVLVSEGNRVTKGEVLVRLEDEEAQAAVAAAQARLAQAQAVLEKLQTGARPEEIRQAEAAAARAEEAYRMAVKGARSQEIEAAVAAADAARAQRDEARATFNRVQGLQKGSAISKAQFDQAKHALEAAEAQYKAARERQNLAMEGARAEEINMAKAASDQAGAALDLIRNGARKEDIAAAVAVRDAAIADVARAQAALDETVVIASTGAVVESIDVHPGDLVKPGPIVSLVNPDDLEMYVYVSEAMLGYLKVGQPVTITTDAFGSEEFEATIVYIAPKGEYTPRNLQTTEERLQQAFGVKLDIDSAGGRLKAGMSATAHLKPASETTEAS